MDSSWHIFLEVFFLGEKNPTTKSMIKHSIITSSFGKAPPENPKGMGNI